jgi:hypothetical protein
VIEGMKRRKFIALIGGTAVALPLTAPRSNPRSLE